MFFSPAWEHWRVATWEQEFEEDQGDQWGIWRVPWHSSTETSIKASEEEIKLWKSEASKSPATLPSLPPEDTIAASTPLALKLWTWSTIKATNGVTTTTTLLLEALTNSSL